MVLWTRAKFNAKCVSLIHFCLPKRVEIYYRNFFRIQYVGHNVLTVHTNEWYVRVWIFQRARGCFEENFDNFWSNKSHRILLTPMQVISRLSQAHRAIKCGHFVLMDMAINGSDFELSTLCTRIKTLIANFHCFAPFVFNFFMTIWHIKGNNVGDCCSTWLDHTHTLLMVRLWLLNRVPLLYVYMSIWDNQKSRNATKANENGLDSTVQRFNQSFNGAYELFIVVRISTMNNQFIARMIKIATTARFARSSIKIRRE